MKQRSVLAVVLGGGAGTRLAPLTTRRSKPAVPFGGKYRIIDVPLSNCINSNINRIFILTQYNSASLNRHVTTTYRFSTFTDGFADILAAEQTPRGEKWFQGTADAVRQVLHHLQGHKFDRVLILSGDQLYQMDFRELLEYHVEQGAEATVATTPVNAKDASAFGIMQTEAGGRIRRFVEKPPPDRLEGLESETTPEMKDAGRLYLASMGIYVFERETLFRMLQEDESLKDFGRHVLPLAIEAKRVYSYPFSGYWTDIGTIDSFFEANLALTDPVPDFNLYDVDNPIYTHARMLPPTKLRDARLDSCMVAPGCILEGCHGRRSVIGVRSILRPGSQVDQCIVMGADDFETSEDDAHTQEVGLPHQGIGEGSRLMRVIVDKRARIGRDVEIRGEAGRADEDGEGYSVRDGIVIVHKNAVIPDGTVI